MKTKTIKIALEGFGSYLGMEKGCFTVKNTVDWPKNCHIRAWIALESGNENLQRYSMMQDIRKVQP